MPPANFFTTTCDLYRPFGDATPTTTAIPCRLTPDFASGQRGSLSWTHYMDVADDVDVQDGCSRTAGVNDLNFADGDEVRVGSVRFVVVWVERHNLGTTAAFQRAFLMRH